MAEVFRAGRPRKHRDHDFWTACGTTRTYDSRIFSRVRILRLAVATNLLTTSGLMSLDRAMDVAPINLGLEQDNRPIEIPSDAVIDQSFSSTRLLEMEDVLNRMVSRQRLVPLTR